MKIQVYRKFVNTSNRVRVLLRPMTAADQELVSEMFCQRASVDDVRYLKENVRDPGFVAGWFTDINYEKVVPLLALHNDKLVGDATLHLQKGASRHVGELRIFLTREFRGVGLGSLLLQELIQLGGSLGLRFLVAQVI